MSAAPPESGRRVKSSSPVCSAERSLLPEDLVAQEYPEDVSIFCVALLPLSSITASTVARQNMYLSRVACGVPTNFTLGNLLVSRTFFHNPHNSRAVLMRTVVLLSDCALKGFLKFISSVYVVNPSTRPHI